MRWSVIMFSVAIFATTVELGVFAVAHRQFLTELETTVGVSIGGVPTLMQTSTNALARIATMIACLVFLIFLSERQPVS